MNMIIGRAVYANNMMKPSISVVNLDPNLGDTNCNVNFEVGLIGMLKTLFLKYIEFPIFVYLAKTYITMASGSDLQYSLNDSL
jgi:hypothetical protein